MAESLDNFNDLEELGINDLEEGDLSNNFAKAASHLQTLAASTDAKTLLTLYGYYKQATEGPCNVAKPSWFDMKAKSKWEAWNSLGDLPSGKAKHLYVEAVKKLDPSFNIEQHGSSSNTSWVVVSSLQHYNKSEHLDSTEKSLVDYVKDCDIKNVTQYLESSQTIDLNELDDDGLSLLHWAADRGSAVVLTALMSHGATVNIKDADGQTPLHYAVSCGHLDCVRILLNHGADVNIQDNDGVDVLSLAQDDSVKNMLFSL